MRNPFIYGEVVTGGDFADRKDEVTRLLQDLKDGEKIFLISPRRYGKTSLIVNTLEKLKKEGLYTIYIDLYKATSLHKLLELYAREIAQKVETKIERAIHLIKEALPRVRPKITIGTDGSPSIGIDYINEKADVLRSFDELFELPQKIALKKKKNFVIVFDEFQEIRDFDGESLEKSMRSCIQHQRNVAYLFAGSKTHMIEDMVFNKDRAFYKLGKVMNLDKIPRAEFKKFLAHKFKITGFSLDKGTLDEILDKVENYPYNAQFLCHELWDRHRDGKKINITDVKACLKKIVNEQTPFYITLWDNLTINQRDVLSAIVNIGDKRIFSQDFTSASGIKPHSTLQTSVSLLIKKGFLAKSKNTYEITDVFFKEWIRLMTG